MLFRSPPNFDTIFEAGNGADAMQIAREERPELIILDLAMPSVAVIEGVRRAMVRFLGIVGRFGARVGVG